MVDSPSEKNVARRMTMPQDIRYATEPTEQEKLVEKFTNYVVSETKTSFIRFLIDRRQKNLLFNSNEFNVEKFDVTIEVSCVSHLLLFISFSISIRTVINNRRNIHLNSAE